MASQQDEQELLRCQQRRLAAMVAVDLATLDELLAEDMTYTHSSGTLESKTQHLDALRSGRLNYESLTADDVRVRIYGDVGIVTGTSTIGVASGGQSRILRVRFTDVYHRANGRWQMVAWQSTRLPEV